MKAELPLFSDSAPTCVAELLIHTLKEAGTQLGIAPPAWRRWVFEESAGQCQDCLHTTKSLCEQAPRPAKTSSDERPVKQTAPLLGCLLFFLIHQPHGLEAALNCRHSDMSQQEESTGVKKKKKVRKINDD